jgi:predicted enzyme related to lactoylglutathione lyase
MKIDVLFASVPVADLATGTAWYERLLGRPPDIVPNEHEVMWQIADGAWLYALVDPDRAGQTLISLCVANLDDATTAIEQRGIRVASTETILGAGRKAWFSDPDGNAVAVIEVVPPNDE